MNKRIYSSLLILALLGMGSFEARAQNTTTATAPQDPNALGDGLAGKLIKKDAEDTKKLQQILIDLKYLDIEAPTGNFLDKSKQALAAFRRDQGIKGGKPTQLSKADIKALNQAHAEFLAKKAQTNTPATPAPSSFAEISKEDLQGAGITGNGFKTFAGEVVLSGELPKECSDRLSLVSSDRLSLVSSEPTPGAEGLAGKMDVAVRYEQKPGDAYKDFADCLTQNKGKNVRSFTVKGFFKEPKNGVTLVLPDGTELESELLKALGKLQEQCENCTAAQRRDRFNEIIKLKNPALEASAKVQLEKLIEQAAIDIRNAKSIGDLEKIRKNLMTTAQDAGWLEKDRDELRDKIRGLYKQILDKASLLAKDSRKCSDKSSDGIFSKSSSCATVGQYADFAAETFRDLATLPGLTAEERSLISDKAKEYEEGSLERVKFIANIDPVNEEVTDAIQSGRNELRSAAYDVQRECAYLTPQTFSSCNQAKKGYMDLTKTYQDLYQRYSANTFEGQYLMPSPLGMGGYMTPSQFAPGMSAGMGPMNGFQNRGMNGMFQPAPFMGQMNNPFAPQMNNPFAMNAMFQPSPFNGQSNSPFIGQMSSAFMPNGAQQMNAPMGMDNGIGVLQVNTGLGMMR